MAEDLSYKFRKIYMALVPTFLRNYVNKYRFQRAETNVLLYAQKTLAAIIPPNSDNPVFLRRFTTDFFAFHEIFVGKSVYDVALTFEPKFIVDCGANIGLASIFFALKYPQARIVSIEPETSNYELLARNIIPYKNISAVKSGVWSKTGKLYITNPSGSTIGFHTEEVKPGMNVDPLLCMDAVGIQEIRQNRGYGGGGGEGWRYIDILKVDIEGAEEELFGRNYEEWLPKVKVIIIELHGQKRIEIFKNTISKYRFKEMSFSGSGIGVYFNEDLITR